MRPVFLLPADGPLTSVLRDAMLLAVQPSPRSASSRLVVENASKLCLLRRRRRALTTGGASAALFRDAPIPRTGLAQYAKGLTLVRLGLLAAALCWCFVAVRLLSAGVMVMETRCALSALTCCWEEGFVDRYRRNLGTVPAWRFPHRSSERERLVKDPAWHPPWQESEG